MNTIFLARRIIDNTSTYEKSGVINDDLNSLPKQSQDEVNKQILEVCMNEWDESGACNQVIGNTIAFNLIDKELPVPQHGFGYLVDFVSNNSVMFPGVNLFNSKVRVRKMTIKKLAKFIEAKRDRKAFLKGSRGAI